MRKKYQKSLFIFRRDLRVPDNRGLLEAAHASHTVIPIFICDPRQVDHTNPYRSMNAIQCMVESLKDLAHQLVQHNGHLYLFYGLPEKVISTLHKEISFDAVFVNHDYTAFSTTRDQAIQDTCTQHTIALHGYHDALLFAPDTIQTTQKKPYSKFSPFFKRALQETVTTPQSLPACHWYKSPIAASIPHTKAFDLMLGSYHTTSSAVHGGRTQGLLLLDDLDAYKKYSTERNIPSISTTHLSAHLKFGTISVREAYAAIVATLGVSHPLKTQLYWRDFFTHIAYHFPAVFQGPFQTAYAHLPWENSTQLFKKWCEGMTGFPIVDAGMRELNTSGFMHNRVRMIVASFLTKDLHIDWRWGEQYFAQRLVDYDPAVNNGNWQWCASTGCDSVPYFRIFNPWLQQKKFDPQALYIKKWVPELAPYATSVIHTWYKENASRTPHYPRPIVDHAIQSKATKAFFRSFKKTSNNK